MEEHDSEDELSCELADSSDSSGEDCEVEIEHIWNHLVDEENKNNKLTPTTERRVQVREKRQLRQRNAQNNAPRDCFRNAQFLSACNSLAEHQLDPHMNETPFQASHTILSYLIEDWSSLAGCCFPAGMLLEHTVAV